MLLELERYLKFCFSSEHTMNNILYYLNGLYALYPGLGLPTASYSCVEEQFLDGSWEMGQGPAVAYVWGILGHSSQLKERSAISECVG